MKNITVTKRELDTIIYPMVAMAKPDSVAKLRVATDVLVYLESWGTQRELTKAELDAGGDPTLAFFEADTEEITLQLEDAWFAFIKLRVKEAAKSFTVVKGREVLPLLERLEGGEGDS